MVGRRHSLGLTGITWVFPIDRTTVYDHSYWSLANNHFFWSSPTPFLSIVGSYWLLGVFTDQGSLTKVDTSCEFGIHFSIPNLVVVITLCDDVRSRCFHLHQVLWGLLSHILRWGTGRTDGCDVYGVVSRLVSTYVFGEGTELSWRPMVTYCPNVGAGGGCC